MQQLCRKIQLKASFITKNREVFDYFVGSLGR